MSNIEPKEIFQWGPPVFVYTLSTQIFKDLKAIKPDKEFTQGKNGTFDKVEIINSRLGYTPNKENKICDLLNPYFSHYIDRLSFDGLKYELAGLWVNSYKAGHFIAPHIHGNCDISFIVYIKSNQDIIEGNDPSIGAGNTIFKYGNSPDSRAIIPYITSVPHKPKDGDLIVFPNNLDHYSVPFNIPNVTRYTLSGNLRLNI